MNCKICANKHLISYTEVGKWELQKCSSCGFVQVVRRPSLVELKDIYSINYFESNKYHDENTLKKEYNYRLNLLHKYLPKGSTILDYGCAKGDFMNFASDNFNLTGVEFSEEAIVKGKKEYPLIGNRLFTIEELEKIPDCSMDCIVLWDVIEHVWNPNETISPILKKLKKNGYLILSTPKIDSLFAILLKKYWPFMTPPEHLSFFSKRAFEEFSKVNDLTILENKSKGKWVNLGFMFYKIKRIAPKIVPNFFINFFKLKYTSRMALYAPTYDIQYLIFEKHS